MSACWGAGEADRNSGDAEWEKRIFEPEKGLFMYRRPLFSVASPLKAAPLPPLCSLQHQASKFGSPGAAAAQYGFCSAWEEWGKFWRKKKISIGEQISAFFNCMLTPKQRADIYRVWKNAVNW